MTKEEEIKSLGERIEKLEKVVFGDTPVSIKTNSSKPLTITALARKDNVKNGQQKLTAIVGYYEKILEKDKITESDIKEGWKDGKFTGAYANVLLQRAIKDVLIRDLKDGTYDLTQDGENFFETVLK